MVYITVCTIFVVGLLRTKIFLAGETWDQIERGDKNLFYGDLGNLLRSWIKYNRRLIPATEDRPVETEDAWENTTELLDLLTKWSSSASKRKHIVK